jgi:hypothetical protein
MSPTWPPGLSDRLGIAGVLTSEQARAKQGGKLKCDDAFPAKVPGTGAARVSRSSAAASMLNCLLDNRQRPTGTQPV